MTDQTIPADKVRHILDEWERIKEYADWDDMDTLVKDIRDLLPPPPRPTLADMTEEERAACRWMQCDYAGETSDATSPGVIGYFDHGGKRAVILTRTCGIVRRDYARVTPRPDLPRMEWPGTGQDGEEATKVDYVPVAGGRTAYGPWTVARLRKKPDTADAVPESTLAVGSVWADADALTLACRESGRDQIVVADKNGDVGVWGAEPWGWRAYAPGPVFAPYTIIHTGREADQ